MKRRAVLCVVPLALAAGCAAESEPAAVRSSPGTPEPVPTDARAPLAKAWNVLRSGRYRVRMTVDSEQYGVFRNDAIVDVDAGITHVVTGFEGESSELITFGDSVLVQSERELRGAPGVPPGATWIHIDGNRIKGYAPKASEFAALADGIGGSVWLASWAGKREIRGRLDTGKVQLGALTNTSGDLAALLVGPEDTARIPFTATLDLRGRLATVDWDLRDGFKPLPITISFTFSEYGTALTPQLPAPATVVEAPEESYRQLREDFAGTTPR